MTPEYKADFYTWAKHNAQLLRSGQNAQPRGNRYENDK